MNDYCLFKVSDHLDPVGGTEDVAENSSSSSSPESSPIVRKKKRTCIESDQEAEILTDDQEFLQAEEIFGLQEDEEDLLV
jgi:hypothetical protein